MYYFLAAVADVAANKYINASAIYYAPNMAFTPSYKGFYNKTLPLFAPRAFRTDDFNDPYHRQGTSTLNTILITDLGAIRFDSLSTNYTMKHYKINEWYNHWLPDNTKRHDSKTTYNVHITHANRTNETFVFHGPPHASDPSGPVQWTRPYFDCERSNKWVLAATSPIVDLNPRHTGWRHIEYPRYVAATVMEIDFERLDINQCPSGEGNPLPNFFAGTARCKEMTTECDPIDGYGFRRGGYQCRCKSGYRLPKIARNPFLGKLIEITTTQQYKKGFMCEKVGNIAVRTQNAEKKSKTIASQLIGQIRTVTGLNKNSTNRLDANTYTQFLKNITPHTCHNFARLVPALTLRGDVAHNKEVQFENQARMALRLANFISSFLQIVNSEDLFAEFRVPDKPLTSEQIIGEILSIVGSDHRIEGAGVLFDRKQFPNRTLFAPYAYIKRQAQLSFYVDDLSRNPPGISKIYTEHEYFRALKTRWTVNTDQLQTFIAKINIRFNSSGYNTIKYDKYPLQYKAAELKDGYWSSPQYDCGSFHNKWLITYSAPFFGWDSLKLKLEFKGVVIVKMDLMELDINQCDDNYYVNNAFKNTHKCDRLSSRCVPMLGRKFQSGGYKCECNQGYEYPFYDPVTYFDGQNLESEFQNMEKNFPSRFDSLKCRIAAGSHLRPSQLIIYLTLIIIFILNFYSN